MPLNGPDESNIKQVRSFSFGHSTEDAKLNKIGSFQVAAIYLIELNGSERLLHFRVRLQFYTLPKQAYYAQNAPDSQLARHLSYRNKPQNLLRRQVVPAMELSSGQIYVHLVLFHAELPVYLLE
jgi:hypothetical protein